MSFNHQNFEIETLVFYWFENYYFSTSWLEYCCLNLMTENWASGFCFSVAKNLTNLSLVLLLKVLLKKNRVLIVYPCINQPIINFSCFFSITALSIYKQACIPETDLIEMLREKNYEHIFFVQRPGSSITKVGLYANPENVLDPNFRKNCSEWQYVERSGELPQVGIFKLIFKTIFTLPFRFHSRNAEVSRWIHIIDLQCGI